MTSRGVSYETASRFFLRGECCLYFYGAQSLGAISPPAVLPNDGANQE